jgi:hypothetical protein
MQLSCLCADRHLLLRSCCSFSHTCFTMNPPITRHRLPTCPPPLARLVLAACSLACLLLHAGRVERSAFASNRYHDI